MALQSSGAISLNEIHVEAGGGSGSQASINDSDIRGLISKASGVQMSFSEWYGASSGVTVPMTTSTTDANNHGAATRNWSAPSGGFLFYNGYHPGINNTTYLPNAAAGQGVPQNYVRPLDIPTINTGHYNGGRFRFTVYTSNNSSTCQITATIYDENQFNFTTTAPSGINCSYNRAYPTFSNVAFTSSNAFSSLVFTDAQGQTMTFGPGDFTDTSSFDGQAFGCAGNDKANIPGQRIRKTPFTSCPSNFNVQDITTLTISGYKG